MAEQVDVYDVLAEIVPRLQSALSGRGDTAMVSTRIPSRYRNASGQWVDGRPPRLVRLRRRGGQRTQTVLDIPVILVECWDDAGDVQAFGLASLVCGLIEALPDGQRITNAEILSLPSDDPDPDTETPRFTCVAQLWVNAA